MAAVHEMEIRVRYQETDGQRRVHHANFLTYFEMGRTEMLRAHGHTYRQFEDAGLFISWCCHSMRTGHHDGAERHQVGGAETLATFCAPTPPR